VSCFARKVTSEVSVSRRRRSPSARSALPLKASLAQLRNPRLLCDEPELAAAVSAWTETESTQKWALSAQEQVTSQAEEVQQRRLEPGRVIRERDQLRSHASEAVSRADVLRGQLAEATERPTEPSARAGFLEETLAAMAQAWC
jgi:heme-degrading monooxygenase HmoA